MHEFIVLRVQPRGDTFIERGPGFKGFFPLRPVGALHVFQESVEIAFLTAEFGGSQRAVLLIRLRQLAFPNDILHDPLICGL